MDQEFKSLDALRLPGESRCTDFVTLRARVQAEEASVRDLLQFQKQQACATPAVCEQLVLVCDVEWLGD